MATFLQSQHTSQCDLGEQLLISHSEGLDRRMCSLSTPPYRHASSHTYITSPSFSTQMAMQLIVNYVNTCVLFHIDECNHMFILNLIAFYLHFFDVRKCQYMNCFFICREGVRTMAKHRWGLLEELPAPDWSHEWNVSPAVFKNGPASNCHFCFYSGNDAII